jgi:ribosomal protein S18 acetylase RimI-like enzyme
MGPVETRTATEADYEFLYDLHRRAFRANVEATWGWDEDWQVRHFREHFNPARCEIIVCDGRDAGCLRVLEETDYIFVDYIAILPACQNQGVGTRLLQNIQARAAAMKVPVRLSVLTVNRARRLYERLGFRVVGNDDVRYYLEAPAAPFTPP